MAAKQDDTGQQNQQPPKLEEKKGIDASPIQPSTLNQNNDKSPQSGKESTKDQTLQGKSMNQSSTGAGEQSRSQAQTQTKQEESPTPPPSQQDQTTQSTGAQETKPPSSSQIQQETKSQYPPPPANTEGQTDAQKQASYKETMPNQSASIGDQDMTTAGQNTQTAASSSSSAGQQPSSSGGDDEKIPQVTSSKSSGSKYPIVLGILVVFALAGLGFAGYQFYQSRYGDDGNTEQIQTDNETPSPTEAPPEISMQNGNIVSTTSSGEETVVIDKSSFDTTGIAGFSSVKVSPDDEWMCFETDPPSPAAAVYLSAVNGTNVTEAGRSRTDCFWLGDSSAVVYENTPDDNNPINIYLFEINSQEETLLTTDIPEDETRFYNIEGIADDGTTVNCTYTTEQTEEPVNCSLQTTTDTTDEAETNEV